MDCRLLPQELAAFRNAWQTYVIFTGRMDYFPQKRCSAAVLSGMFSPPAASRPGDQVCHRLQEPQLKVPPSDAGFRGLRDRFSPRYAALVGGPIGCRSSAYALRAAFRTKFSTP
jgi:hypothetical protein